MYRSSRKPYWGGAGRTYALAFDVLELRKRYGLSKNKATGTPWEGYYICPQVVACISGQGLAANFKL